MYVLTILTPFAKITNCKTFCYSCQVFKICSSRKNAYLMEGHQKFLGGGGALKQGIKLNWNFLGGMGVQNKNPRFCWGEYRYFFHNASSEVC